MKISTFLGAVAVACVALTSASAFAAPATDASKAIHSQMKNDTPMATCLQCHKSYADLAKKTAKLPKNPHDSHKGAVNCTVCHKFQGESVFMCNQCHAFDAMNDVFAKKAAKK